MWEEGTELSSDTFTDYYIFNCIYLSEGLERRGWPGKKRDGRGRCDEIFLTLRLFPFSFTKKALIASDYLYNSVLDNIHYT